MRTANLLVLALCCALPGSSLVGSLAAQEATNRKTHPVPHVLEVTRLAIATPAPKGLGAAEARAYAAETAWLVTVRDRLEAAAIEYNVIPPRDAAQGQATGKRQHKPMEVIAHFDAMRKALEAEGARFNTLTNASKARHDMAMNAIRNMKG
ncbi:MAG: hypothetical protein H0W15_09970 [Gemmatimonadales bacterium]|nr:hypothetical protein [Gemmatimonadales bacterium]